MKKLAVVAAAVVAAAVFPTAALAAFNGVVVGKSRGTFAVASASGAIRTVRSHASPRIGARVHVTGAAVQVLGRAHRVRIHAVIVRRSGGTTFLAGGHSLLAVRMARTLSSVVDRTRPSAGSVVDTTATITAAGQLTAASTQVVGHTGSIQVQAVVTAVGTGTITLSVNGQSLVLALPSGIQLPASLVNQSITLTLNLTGAEPTAAEDDNQADDNDQADDNGNDQADDDNGADDHGGGGDDGND